jgi:tetratricopeptide (TPR) repeat protein
MNMNPLPQRGVETNPLPVIPLPAKLARPKAAHKKRWLAAACLVLLAQAAPAPVIYKPGEGWKYEPAGETVGNRGRKEALIFEGIETFSKEDIVFVLWQQMDFHLAARRGAPLQAYLDTLKKLIGDGYRHGGYGEVRVEAATDKNSSNIVVRVKEGPRYLCGDIQLICGQTQLTNTLLQRKLVEALSYSGQSRRRSEPASNEELEPLLGRSPAEASTSGISTGTEERPVLWDAHAHVCFDQPTQRALERLAAKMLADLGCVDPGLDLKLAPDAARKRADLVITVTDEKMRSLLDGSVRTRIQQIEVSGTSRNTREEVLNYLDVKPGMEMRDSLREDLRKKLRSSGRFLMHDVSLSPLSEPGRLKLVISLADLDEAPPLKEELSPEIKAWLRFGDWLGDMKHRPEDVVLALTPTNKFGWGGEVVISPSGIAGIVSSSGSNLPPGFTYGFIWSPNHSGLYSGVTRRKLIAKGAGRGGVFAVRAVPNPNPALGPPFSVTAGGGFASGSSASLQVQLDFPPAFYLHCSHQVSNLTSAGGVLIAAPREVEDSGKFQLKLDTATGRLLSGVAEITNGLSMRVNSEKGAFRRVIKEIANATTEYTNASAAEPSLITSVIFLITEGLRAAAALETLATNQMPSQLAQVTARVDRWAGTLEKLDLDECFEPLQRLMGSNTVSSFFVPADEEATAKPLPGANPQLLMLGQWLVFNHLDELVPPGSWPWALCREYVFNSYAAPSYTDAEILSLSQSPDLGPFGCKLMAEYFPEHVEAFRARATNVMTPSGIEQDLKLFLNNEYVVGQILSRILLKLASASDELFGKQIANLEPEEAANLRQVIELVRGAKGKPLAAVLTPFVWSIRDKEGPQANLDFLAEFASAYEKRGAQRLQRGKLAEAETDFREALTLKTEGYGPESTNVAASLNKLALALVQEKKLDEATALCRQALQLQKKALGPESPDAAKSLSFLASVLMKQGNMAEAEAKYREALAIQRKQPGKTHEDLIVSLVGLGSLLLQDRSKWPEAEGLSREALAIAQGSPGRESPGIPLLAIRYLLGTVLVMEGKQAEGESSLRQAGFLAAGLPREPGKSYNFALAVKALTTALQTDPRAAQFLIARGFLYGRQGMWQQAALDLTQLFSDFPVLALGPLLVEIGSEPAYTRYRQRILSKLGDTADPETAAQAAIGLLLLPKNGGSAPANQLAEGAVTRGTNHVRLPYYQLSSALSDYRSGKFAGARDWAQRSLSGSGTNYATAASAGAVLAMAQQELNQSDGARKSLEQATQLFETKLPKFNSGDLGENWPEWLVARILLREANRLLVRGPASSTEFLKQAQALARQGKLRDAEKKYSEALAEFPKSAGQSRSSYANLLAQRGALAARQGRYQDAVADISKAKEAYPENPTFHEWLASASVANGDQEGYGRCCREIITRFRGTNSAVVARRMAKACLILPSPGVDLEAVGELAETAATRSKSRYSLPACQFTKGLAEYRQGRFAAAADWIQKSLDRSTSSNSCQQVQSRVVLAMAHYQQKQPEEASKLLATGTDLASRIRPRADSNDLGTAWYDWIIADALTREAKALIEKK